jgi:hypothetical protein
MAKGRKTGGRKPGVPNKVTGDVRAMIVEALQTAGGAQYLAAQAHDNPSAFMALVGRALPKEMTVDNTGSMTLTVLTGVPQPRDA